jgi:hypothetical protein
MVETPVGSVNETLYFEMNRNEHGATDNFDIVGRDSIAKLIEIRWPSEIVQGLEE